MDTQKNLAKLYSLIKPNLKKLEYPLKINRKRLNLYGAGKRFNGKNDYYRIFPRDSFLSVFLLKDMRFLKDLLIFCIRHQGKKSNSRTGEEPGKIPHEWPGVILRGLSTEYNAADTTALFLIGFYDYFRQTGDANFVKKHKQSINSAIYYILKHIKNGIFWEDPKFSKAKRYALKSTYWRDSGLAARRHKIIHFPAAYSLLQAKIVMGFRYAAKLSKKINLGLDHKILESVANETAKTIFNEFWCKSQPASSIDKKGKICNLYSDFLHLLFYLEPSDVPKKKLKEMLRAARLLETPFGYRTYNPREKTYKHGSYHHGTIWPWEQAYIALGAIKHNKKKLAKVALKTVNALIKFDNHFTELFSYDGKKLKPLGCHIQLWTIAYVKAMHDLKI